MKAFVLCVAALIVGLIFGGVATATWIVNSEPAVIVETKWKTVTTAEKECPDLGHTSLNRDELTTLLTIMQTTTTTLPPTTTTTRRPLPPSTLPPSSTTSTTIPSTTTTTNEPTTTTDKE